MISLAQARALIAEKILPLPAVAAPHGAAAGRVLRQDVFASEDLPGFDRSAMDGYAIADDDAAEKFLIVGEAQPGAPFKRKLRPGQCARIFTGAAIPAGATRVLMQEKVTAAHGFMRPLERGGDRHIRRRGEDARAGKLLLKGGATLGAGESALLASVGAMKLKVSPRVRVAHFATGNELAAPERPLRPGHVRDSNSALIAVLASQFGGELVKQARVADDFDLLLKMTRALKKSFDLLLLSGGASVGNYDFGGKLLRALGFRIHFASVNLRPGKPLIFGTRGKQAAFVLPGNPLSHLVTMHVAVRLAFERFAGARPRWPLVNVPLADSHKGALPGNPKTKNSKFKSAGRGHACGREVYCPARLELVDGGLVARALNWQSSGDVTCMAGVNALLQLPAGAAPKAGDSVTALMLEVP